MEKFSTSLIIREILIKTTMSYYLTSVNLTLIKDIKLMSVTMLRKREPMYIICGNVTYYDRYRKKV
jgi:hypothetical protein